MDIRRAATHFALASTLLLPTALAGIAGTPGPDRRVAPPEYATVAAAAGVDVEILVEGRPTPIYRDGGYRWVEGRAGDRFAFRVSNRNAFPVGVVLSADGQSLTSDGRAGASNPAYVVDPYGSLTVGVWREDLHGGRELVFTSVDRSLAARKGDRRNIGVLGVLVWQLADREEPRPVPLDRDERDKSSRGGAAGAPSSQSAPKAAGGDEIRKDDTGIGVGAGGRVTDPAYLTSRYRRVRVLDALALYYDDRQGLLRAGIDLGQYERVPDRRGSDPFPDGGYRGVRIP